MSQCREMRRQLRRREDEEEGAVGVHVLQEIRRGSSLQTRLMCHEDAGAGEGAVGGGVEAPLPGAQRVTMR